MAKRKATAKVAKAPPPIKAYDVSDRVRLQAAVRPYQNVPHAPLVRPLRIYTLDPSVSDRLGGTATVNVPYEKLEPGPIGSLFAVEQRGAPEQLQAAPSISTIRFCCFRAACRRHRPTAGSTCRWSTPSAA